MANRNQVTLNITAQDNASRQIARVQRQLQTLQKTAAATATSMSRISKAFTTTTGRVNKLNTSMRRASTQTQTYRKRVDSLRSSLTSTGQAASNFNTNIGSATVGLGAFALAGGAAFTSFVRAAGNLQQVETSFTALLGSSEKAEQAIAALRDAASAPGLTFEVARQGAQRFLSLGVSIEDTTQILRGFANSAVLSGTNTDQLNEGLRQLFQVVSRGKFEQEDLNSILERFGTISAVVRREWGNSAEEINANLQRTNTSVLEMIRSVSDLSRQPTADTQTLSTAMSNLQNAVQQLAEALGRSLVGPVQRVTQVITAMINRFNALPPVWQDTISIGGAIVTALLGIAATAGVVAGAIAKLGPVFVGIFTTLRSFAGLIVRVSGGLVRLGGVGAIILTVVNALILLGKFTFDAARAMRRLQNVTERYFNLLRQQFKTLGDFVERVNNFSREANAAGNTLRFLNKVLALFVTLTRGQIGPLNDLFKEVMTLTSEFDEFAKAAEPAIDVVSGVTRGLRRQFNNIEDVQAALDRLTEAYIALRLAGVDVNDAGARALREYIDVLERVVVTEEQRYRQRIQNLAKFRIDVNRENALIRSPFLLGGQRDEEGRLLPGLSRPSLEDAARRVRERGLQLSPEDERTLIESEQRIDQLTQRTRARPTRRPQPLRGPALGAGPTPVPTTLTVPQQRAVQERVRRAQAVWSQIILGRVDEDLRELGRQQGRLIRLAIPGRIRRVFRRLGTQQDLNRLNREGAEAGRRFREQQEEAAREAQFYLDTQEFITRELRKQERAYQIAINQVGRLSNSFRALAVTVGRLEGDEDSGLNKFIRGLSIALNLASQTLAVLQRIQQIRFDDARGQERSGIDTALDVVSFAQSVAQVIALFHDPANDRIAELRAARMSGGRLTVGAARAIRRRNATDFSEAFASGVETAQRFTPGGGAGGAGGDDGRPVIIRNVWEINGRVVQEFDVVTRELRASGRLG